MSVFDEVRHISAREAAERAGIALKRRGDKAWALCPLHRERTPSLCLYEEPGRGWYCFGCHRGGDAVKLYEEVFHLKPVEAAKALAGVFGILIDAPSPTRHTTESSLSFLDDEQVEELKFQEVLDRACKRVWQAQTRLDQLKKAGLASPDNSVYMAAVRVLELAEASLSEKWKALDAMFPDHTFDHNELLDAYIANKLNMLKAAQGSRAQQRAPHAMQMKNSTRSDRS